MGMKTVYYGAIVQPLFARRYHTEPLANTVTDAPANAGKVTVVFNPVVPSARVAPVKETTCAKSLPEDM